MEQITDANYYQKQCMRFASDVSKASNDNLLLQGALGLCGECGEVVEMLYRYVEDVRYDEEQKVHFVKELGDVLWYCATTARGLELDFDKIFLYMESTESTNEENKTDYKHTFDYALQNAVSMTVQACAISDVMKKIVFHGHTLDQHAAYTIKYRLGTIADCVLSIGQNYLDVSFSEIMTRNIEKLSARYPEGHFDTERSLHRKAGDI